MIFYIILLAIAALAIAVVSIGVYRYAKRKIDSIGIEEPQEEMMCNEDDAAQPAPYVDYKPKYNIGADLQIRATSADELTAIGMDTEIANLHENATGYLNSWPVTVIAVRPSTRFRGFEYVTTDETRNENDQLIECTYPEICLSPLVISAEEQAELNGEASDAHLEEFKEVINELIKPNTNEKHTK